MKHLFPIVNSGAKNFAMIHKMKKLILLFPVILMLIFTVILSFANETKTKSIASDAVEKGWAYFNRGDLETALKRFNQATIIDPNFAPGYFGRAYVYSVQDNLDLAIE